LTLQLIDRLPNRDLKAGGAIPHIKHLLDAGAAL